MRSFFKIVLGSCLGIFLAFIAVFAIGAIVIGSFSSSMSSNSKVIDSESILRIDMSTPMPDKTNNIASEPFSFENNTFVGVIDAIKLINHAKTDDKIKGIYINPGGNFVSGPSAIKDLHEALMDFKTSKKFVYAYGENLTQGGYYISSVADKIFLNPMGDVTFRGMSIGMMYFKNLLEKLNIKMNIFYVGKFKSATEPLRADHMSTENRLQLKTFLNGMFDQTIADIALSRKIDVAQIKNIASQLLIQDPEDALKYKFIDQIAYEDEVFSEIKAKLKLKEKDKLHFVSLSEYYDATTLSKDYNASDKIAVIYAEGEINDGNGHDGEIGGQAYVQYLRKARFDDKIKAVVLRVNSPGGSAFASEQMWREIELIKKAGKKVVVSMGDYAASGGYYISCNADSIFANPNTITGSIGVFGIIPNLSGFFKDKLYITMDSVMTGPNAMGMSPYFDLNQTEANAIQKSVEKIYSTFTGRVSKGRKLSQVVVDSLAQGRIYSGNDALKIGLVDKIGGLDAAIASAVKMTKLKEYRVVEYPETKPPLQKIMDKISGKEESDDMVKGAVEAEIAKLAPEYIQAKKMLKNNKIQARLPFVVQYQ
ncbi:MAG: signal peptide peptidase SppA [Saprospiraceae bacterium]